MLFDGTDRILGGIPLLENQNIAFAEVKKINPDRIRFIAMEHKIDVQIEHPTVGRNNIVGLYLRTNHGDLVRGSKFGGLFFDGIPAYRKGVAFWRYKPWNSWTKPVRVTDPGLMETWDVQCFYWQYEDNLYGAAIPLSGQGFRTTLGGETGKFGSKAVSYDGQFQSDTIPAMVIGFDTDPYRLMADLYKAGMEMMHQPENLRVNKQFPEPLKYIGWCTWNASDLGRHLNEKTILDGVASFTDHGFPLGWVLIDDGWFDQSNGRLRSFYPDKDKFPRLFKPLIQKLKSDYQLKHVGLWHAFDGYWNGIDPDSPLGEHFKNELFYWKQKDNPANADSREVTYAFIKPTSDSLFSFYNQWHAWIQDQGFSFVKVDNQLVVERMCVDNYPIWQMASAMHSALNKSVQKHFGNAIINCMDMTNDAFYNFGSTAVARSVEDYFPYDPYEDYNLQHGNAAAHVLQAVYNSFYFSNMVYPDFDMFQSHNPNAEFHAIARAINDGPIYVTDNIGAQHFDLLKKLVYHDGAIIRSEQPLAPAEDCLFQIQDAQPFKAFSRTGNIGLLGVWNCADADEVKGYVGPADVHGIEGQQFALYDYFDDSVMLAKIDTKFPVTLKQLGYRLFFVLPLQNSMAPVGLINKYNAPATIDAYEIDGQNMMVTLHEPGVFSAILPSPPVKVLLNGKETKDYSYHKNIFKLMMYNVDMDRSAKVSIRIQ